ncbi:MAG: hypothetical protein M1596_03400 [Firmicutes bacterium]|jgi:hypothetical protein|nr:hypothetical protein [Bacillota bacterium]
MGMLTTAVAYAMAHNTNQAGVTPSVMATQSIHVIPDQSQTAPPIFSLQALVDAQIAHQGLLAESGYPTVPATGENFPHDAINLVGDYASTNINARGGRWVTWIVVDLSIRDSAP